MDKQIIIDGCDVSGCECYSEHREGYCGWHIPCEGDICPYKLKWALQQLKRKEQECEELETELNNWKEQVELQSNFIDGLLKATNNSEWLDKSMLDDEVSEVIEKIELDYEQLDQLKAENEELKKIIKRLDVPKHEVIDMDIAWENEKLKEEKQGLIKDWEEKKNLAYEIACKNEKLKQVLKEIKEIAENGKRFAERWMITGEQKANVLTYANAILQKISEVEDETTK